MSHAIESLLIVFLPLWICLLGARRDLGLLFLTYQDFRMVNLSSDLFPLSDNKTPGLGTTYAVPLMQCRWGGVGYLPELHHALELTEEL